MRLLAWLIPGFVQWRAGRRAAALALGTAAGLVLGVVVAVDLGYLEIYNRLRAPRSVAKDLWAEKGEARRHGLAALAAVVALGILHGLATGPAPASNLPVRPDPREAVPS